MPHLKRGAIRNFLSIMEEHGSRDRQLASLHREVFPLARLKGKAAYNAGGSTSGARGGRVRHGFSDLGLEIGGFIEKASCEVSTASPSMTKTPITNGKKARDTTSPHWRGWLRPESRCLVPFNSFTNISSGRRQR
jgi:hypothetical protein